MDAIEKNITYRTTNTYSTLNDLSDETKCIWIVLHGIGYLSRYFIKYFNELPQTENYIIAPQAPSKYYLKDEYRHVGASWLTKENTVEETKNIIAYMDSLYKKENIPNGCKLIIFGFSQGVSVAARWVAATQLKCDHLALYAGGIPNELVPKDFEELLNNGMKVTVFVGNQDEYLTEGRLKIESDKIQTLFYGKARQIVFEGGHEVKKELLNTLIQ